MKFCINRLEASNLVLQDGLHVHMMWYSSAHINLIMYEMTIWCKLTWPACHDSAWWLEPYDCTLMTCVSTLSNALILLAIEIAILSGASTRWWQSSRRWTPTRMPKTKKYKTSPSERAIPYHAIMNCLRCLSLMMHPSWLRGSRFLLGWSLTKISSS